MSDAKEEKQLTVRMPKALHKELKMLCTEEELVVNAVANEAIAQWIERYRASKKKTA